MRERETCLNSKTTQAGFAEPNSVGLVWGWFGFGLWLGWGCVGLGARYGGVGVKIWVPTTNSNIFLVGQTLAIGRVVGGGGLLWLKIMPSLAQPTGFYNRAECGNILPGGT